MERQLLFNRFKEDIEKNTQFALGNFSDLSEKQFNWRPNPEKWTIGQCIQHINMISRHWIKQFEKVIKSGVKSPNTGDYRPGILGSYLLKVITPVPAKKFKTMEIFLPHNMANNKATIDEFLDFQRRFTEISEKMRGYDLEKNKLDSMVYSFINLRLGDALTIINQHTARHLNQAFNVLSSPEFPKA